MTKKSPQQQRDDATVQDRIDVAVMKSDIGYIKSTVTDLKSSLQSNYIGREEFEPIKKIVYGMVGLILVAVVGALMALLLK